MNQELINELEKVRIAADVLGEVYKEKAYSNAIANIKKLDYVIDLDNLEKQKIAGVGPGILGKIREFLTKGYISELNELLKNKKYKAFVELSKIIGVGPATIKTWINKKIYSVADLRRAISKSKIKLNHMQALGLKYYVDLNLRIPRNEVGLLGNYVKKILLKIDSDIKFEITGSYRRGRVDCGDIDILVTNPKMFNEGLLPKFIDNIREDKNFIDVLSKGKERVTFLYYSPVSKLVRQIDVLNLPYNSYFAAILYFTGSGPFNVSMRGYAKNLGYRLNQNGLYKIEDGKLNLVIANSEKDIFDILGLQFVPPEYRIDSRQIVPK
jgi:DNA polymerase/3'-5' exonuclease PolX